MNQSPLRIENVMTRAPHTIRADEPLTEARHLIRMHRIRHLPVMQGGELVGVLSERDIFWIESLRPEDASVRVGDAMTPYPYFVSPHDRLDKVVREMADAKFGAAVVMEEGHPVGIFTAHDALRVLAELLAGGPARRSDSLVATAAEAAR